MYSTDQSFHCPDPLGTPLNEALHTHTHTHTHTLHSLQCLTTEIIHKQQRQQLQQQTKTALVIQNMLQSF